MLEDLKERVYADNMALPRHGLVTFTWGNVSGLDRESGLVIIKPSGVPYEELRPNDMVVMDLAGKRVEGKYNPSSDTDTHLVLYNAFAEIGGIVHTHSTWATVCAQAGQGIIPYGTTHADYFHGEILCTRDMTMNEINGDYEHQTGQVIIETCKERGAMPVPAVLVKSHGPFTWGADSAEAVHNAVVLEEVAKMFVYTRLLQTGVGAMDTGLLDKHFLRKHGAGAYYGQKP